MQQIMEIGNRVFEIGRHTYIMAILNVTPDSFSDGGSYRTMDDALRRVEQMLAEGADMIDVGGESTRPGHVPVSDTEEMNRVAPVIAAITERFDVPVSVDTYKASVAEAALQSGAHLVNDIWGLQRDPAMAGLIARYHAACCLMHNQTGTQYTDLLADCLGQLRQSADLARQAGVPAEKIMLDPGIGFGKTCAQNLYLMKHLAQFHALQYPLLLGASRKSMIGLTLDLPVEQRLEGTLATTMLAVQAGWSFVRVHDVKENNRVIKMLEVIRDSHLE